MHRVGIDDPVSRHSPSVSMTALGSLISAARGRVFGECLACRHLCTGPFRGQALVLIEGAGRTGLWCAVMTRQQPSAKMTWLISPARQARSAR
uniref:Uncharacterized protein n=1 Tax=Streptomyces sp. F12 TaxID=1436084 RepID=V9Z8A3_9ACTN|nr:hypothetical protein pFRL6_152 [Streptomyces sp. F12]